MVSPQERTRTPIIGETLGEQSRSDLDVRAQVVAKDHEAAFQPLVDVAREFAFRADKVNTVPHIRLYDEIGNPFGLAEARDIQSVSVVSVDCTAPSGETYQYAYPIVRVVTQGHIKDLAIATEEGLLFRLSKKPGFDDFDLRTVSDAIGRDNRFPLFANIGLEADSDVSIGNMDSIPVGRGIDLESRWRIHTSIYEFSSFIQIAAIGNMQRLLHETLQQVSTLADGSPASSR